MFIGEGSFVRVIVDGGTVGWEGKVGQVVGIEASAEPEQDMVQVMFPLSAYNNPGLANAKSPIDHGRKFPRRLLELAYEGNTYNEWKNAYELRETVLAGIEEAENFAQSRKDAAIAGVELDISSPEPDPSYLPFTPRGGQHIVAHDGMFKGQTGKIERVAPAWPFGLWVSFTSGVQAWVAIKDVHLTSCGNPTTQAPVPTTDQVFEPGDKVRTKQYRVGSVHSVDHQANHILISFTYSPTGSATIPYKPEDLTIMEKANPTPELKFERGDHVVIHHEGRYQNASGKILKVTNTGGSPLLAVELLDHTQYGKHTIYSIWHGYTDQVSLTKKAELANFLDKAEVNQRGLDEMRKQVNKFVEVGKFQSELPSSSRSDPNNFYFMKGDEVYVLEGALKGHTATIEHVILPSGAEPATMYVVVAKFGTPNSKKSCVPGSYLKYCRKAINEDIHDPLTPLMSSWKVQMNMPSTDPRVAILESLQKRRKDITNKQAELLSELKYQSAKKQDLSKTQTDLALDATQPMVVSGLKAIDDKVKECMNSDESLSSEAKALDTIITYYTSELKVDTASK